MFTTLLVVTGFFAGFAWSHFHWKTAYRNLYKASLKALKDQHDTNSQAVYTRVRAKVAEINRIMEAQLALWGQVDGPNKGASHSRWKRDLVGQINDLEAEKMDTFRDILSDGVDLTVSMIDSNGMKCKKKMSRIVKEFDASNADNPPTADKPKTPAVKPTIKNDPNKKLRLVKESKLSLEKGKNNDRQST